MNGVQRYDKPDQALVVSGPGQFALVSRDQIAGPGPDELLLAPVAVGLCATDLELIDGTMVYLRQGASRLPMVPGHEWVARVEEVGAAVTDFSVNDLVVGECSIGCGHCPTCRSGSYHRCVDRRETGIMRLDGALASRLIFPARAAHRVPQGVRVDDAALTEPLAVAYRAVQRAEIAHDSKVLVVGAGTIGLLALQVLAAITSARTFAADIAPIRIEAAERLGARRHEVGLYQHVIEATGTAAGIQAALASLAPGGRLVLVGLTGAAEVSLPIDDVVTRDQQIVGSLGSPRVWPDVLDLLARGDVHPSSIITHEFELTEVDAAIRLAREHKPETGKILIRVGSANG